MCNNIAIISKDDKYDQLIAEFKLGLALGRSKGEKGTGYYHNGRIVRSKSGKYYYDDTHDSLKFLVGGNSWFFAPNDNYNVFMGHNRAPSTGMGRGDEFVHPFEYGEKGNRTIFQHNGTVTNIREICTQFNLNFKDFENDSKVLGHLIHAGVNKHELFKAYRGACTCIWYDETTSTLNIFKGASEDKTNKVVAERELFYFKYDNTYYFNTQEEILNVLHDWDDGVDIIDFPINTIVTIDKNLIWSEDKVNRIVPFIHPPKKITGTTSSYRGNTSKAATPYFINDKNADFHCVWYKGYYYYNGRLLHGERRFNAKGKSDPNGYVYYFFNGQMLKNKECFDKAVQRGEADNQWYHKRYLGPYTAGSKLLWMFNGQKVKNSLIATGLFMTHKVKITNKQIVEASNRNAQHYDVSYLNTVNDIDEGIKRYNEHFGTEFKRLSECEIDFSTRYKALFSKAYGGYSAPFLTIVNGVDQDMNNVYIDDYNYMSGNNFITIEQCQDHYCSSMNLDKKEDTSIVKFYETLDELAHTGEINSIVSAYTNGSLIDSQF